MPWRWWYKFMRLYENGRLQSAIKVTVFILRGRKKMYLSPTKWF